MSESKTIEEIVSGEVPCLTLSGRSQGFAVGLFRATGGNQQFGLSFCETKDGSVFNRTYPEMIPGPPCWETTRENLRLLFASRDEALHLRRALDEMLRIMETEEASRVDA